MILLSDKHYSWYLFKNHFLLFFINITWFIHFIANRVFWMIYLKDYSCLISSLKYYILFWEAIDILRTDTVNGTLWFHCYSLNFCFALLIRSSHHSHSWDLTPTGGLCTFWQALSHLCSEFCWISKSLQHCLIS